jgi:transcriptional regulator with XRE-family HTH domain
MNLSTTCLNDHDRTELRSFGEWLRLKRKAHDLTREGLAERVGYSAATIRKLEAEERRPSAQLARRLTDLFNMPPEERTTFLAFCPRRLAGCSPLDKVNLRPGATYPHHRARI